MNNIMDIAIDGYKKIKADKIIGIFGHPIKHTLSPIIHDSISEILELDERYVPFNVKPDMNLGDCVTQAFNDNVLGLNITVPYKQEVMKYLVDIDDAAKAIGAVNTLVRTSEGYKGYNTDMPGLAMAMESEGFSLEGKDVIMLGAGGAARAVAFMCGKYGASSVTIINRTKEKAQIICDDIKEHFKEQCLYTALSAEDISEVKIGKYIMFQCTSIGLKEEDGLPLTDDEAFYEMASAGIDLIYNPARTNFIKMMEKKNIPHMNGLKMLLYQGILAYQYWNKITVDNDTAGIVYNKLCDKLYGKNIILTGYMGCGKTTVGKSLANKLNYNFIDTDEYIESTMKMSISEIFKKYGEQFFREYETECLIQLASKLGNCVISTGGGVPVKVCNREILKNMGRIYYLKADADTIYARVKYDKKRPLLQCDNPYEKIKSMLEQREEFYREAADEVICVDGLSVKDIVSAFDLQ